MPTKKSPKRPAVPKPSPALLERQRVLDDTRRLRKINQAIVKEGNTASRLVERGNVVLGRILTAYSERAGLISIDGAQYAALLDRVDVLHKEADDLRAKLDASRTRELETIGAGR